jgi:hypothetical protein
MRVVTLALLSLILSWSSALSAENVYCLDQTFLRLLQSGWYDYSSCQTLPSYRLTSQHFVESGTATIWLPNKGGEKVTIDLAYGTKARRFEWLGHKNLEHSELPKVIYALDDFAFATELNASYIKPAGGGKKRDELSNFEDVNSLPAAVLTVKASEVAKSVCFVQQTVENESGNQIVAGASIGATIGPVNGEANGQFSETSRTLSTNIYDLNKEVTTIYLSRHGDTKNEFPPITLQLVTDCQTWESQLRFKPEYGRGAFGQIGKKGERVGKNVEISFDGHAIKLTAIRGTSKKEAWIKALDFLQSKGLNQRDARMLLMFYSGAR